MKSNILIVDDEPSICASLSFALKAEYTAKAVCTASDAITLITSESFDVALLDLRIGGDDGIDVLKQIKEISPATVVIMMTAYGSIGSSVEAMRCGAFNYLTKPLDLEELMLFIRQAIDFKNLNEQVTYLSDELDNYRHYDEMVGESPPMQMVYAMIEKLKDVDAGVLITGESGTGKELVSKAIHDAGRRQKGRFVVVNCAAIPENLLEVEFFGYKRGAFTGAAQDRKGKFELADKGTIFLDEIGDMSLNLQGKLLRVLQDKKFTPVGGSDVHHVDVRVIAATNRDLHKMVQLGTFRQDLYYRINVTEVKMPPLRERKSDIPHLCAQFIKQFGKEQNKQVRGVSDRAQQMLLDYDYPGNVRQLANFMEYATIFCTNGIIDVNDLPEDISKIGNNLPVLPAVDFDSMLIGIELRQLEKRAIEATLKKNGGRRQQTAIELGISKRGLLNKINEYGLKEQ